MAIYSLHLGFVSRSEGRSSVGFAAYIAGEKAFDERTGRTFNFSHKADEVLVSDILLPEGAPAWMNDRETFWNAVEKFEDHIADLRFQGGEKSQLAKEKFIASAQSSQTGMGAIPIELTKDQAEKCVKEFLETRFVSRKLAVDYAIHWEEGNPHFHAMVTRRTIENGTFSHRKDRELVSKAEVIQTRKIWEQVANKHLEMAGHEARIDARSNADRGSFFMATEHEGWHAQRLAEEGKYARIVHENEQVRQKNIQLIAEKPETLIHELTLKRTTFTQKHVEDEIIKRVGGDETLFEILRDGLRAQNIEGISEKSPLSDVAHRLTAHLLRDENITRKAGENIDRKQIYTSRTYKEHEERIVSSADALNDRSRSLDVGLIDRSIAKLETELNRNRGEGEPRRQLSDEQKVAVYHLCSGSDIRMLNGRAGTGKTTLLKAVAEAYQAAGYEVIGTSFQGKAVEIMQKEIGISCRTLDSLIYHWDKYAEKKALVESGKLWGDPYLKAHQQMKQLENHFFHKKSVIIVDEANMIGGKLWERFLTEASSRGAKVLGVQDPAQIKSRDPGDVGRLLSERFGAAEVSTVMRQRVSWQARCSEHLNDHQVLNGLKPYQEKGHLQWFENDHQAREKLSADFVKAYRQNPTQIALAYTNEEVDSLNRSIRAILKTEGLLGKQMTFKETEYAVGDKIRFTENDNHGQFVRTLPRSFRDLFTTEKGAGVKNGSIGRIDSIRSSKIVVNLEDGRKVSFNPHAYDKFTHGYAMTVNKSEGSTVDGTFVLPSRQMDPHTTLVSMTRHRQDVQMYVSRETFVDFKDLVDTLSKGHFHETLQDYKVTDAQQPYLDRVRQYKDLLIEAVTLREEMEGSLKPNEPLYKHKSYESYQLCFEQKKETAKLILQDWSHHKPFTRLAGIRKDVLEVEVGLRPRLLSDLEQRASIQVDGYKDTVRTASALWEVIQKTHPSSLSKDHNLYAQYDAIRQERDSIASEFKNAPKLYQQFFREEDRQTKVHWASVTSHAQAWEKRLNEERYVNGLSPQEKESYALLKEYTERRSQAAALYGKMKENGNTLDSLQKEELQARFKDKSIQRDALALSVFRKLEACEPHFARVRIDEDKFLKQAVQGEIRESIKIYLSQTSPLSKAEAARELQAVLRDTSSYRLVKEAGIESQRIKFDVAFGEALKGETVQASLNPEKLYPEVREYLRLHQEACKLWSRVKKGEDDLRTSAEQAFKVRDGFLEKSDQHNEMRAVLSLLNPSSVRQVERNVVEKESLLPSDSSKQVLTYSAEQILHEAKHNYASLARSLLGQENKHMSTANALRFGNKGSLVMNVGGAKAGLWHDFSSGEGGNIFSLVQREKGCDFKESLTYLGQQLGLLPDQTFKENLKEPVEVIQEQKIESDAEKIMKIAAVQVLYKESKTTRDGTVALSYLRNERKITTGICDDLREIPKGTRFLYQGKERELAHTCLAAFGRDKDGTLLSVQLTKLKEDGTRATLVTGEKLAKIKYGIGKEAFVTLQSKPESQTVIIAEGVETALSIKQTGIDATIVAAQGIHNIKNYQGTEKHIVLAADNDDHKPNSGTHKVIAQAQEHFKAQGNDVTVIKPQTPGDDFNDVLKKQGVEGVKDHLKNIGTHMETKIDTVAKETNAFQNLSFKEKARILREQRTGRSSQNDKSTGIEWD